MSAIQKSSRPKVMFLTSANGGLAHYVLHLRDEVGKYCDTSIITYADHELDDLVRMCAPDVQGMLRPDDQESIAEIVRQAARQQVSVVNLHVGTKVKLHVEYFQGLLFALRQGGARVITHLHDVAIHRSSCADLTVIRSLALLSDGVLMGSVKELEVVRGMLPDPPVRLGLMRHGPYVKMDRRQFADQQRAREYLALAPSSRVILSFGAMRDEKRLEDLVAAFYSLWRERGDLSLVIQTDLSYNRPKMAWLREVGRHPGICVMTGYASLDRVEALFRAADVVALPYERAAASGVLNLARSFHRPVVLTDCFEQAAEIHGVCGVVVRPRDPRDLAAGLAKALDHAKALGESWQHVMVDESWRQAAENFMSAWLDLSPPNLDLLAEAGLS